MRQEELRIVIDGIARDIEGIILSNMNEINKQQKDLMKTLSNIKFDIMREALPNLTKMNQIVKKIKIPDSIFREINELASVRKKFSLSLQPILEQQKILGESYLQSAKQLEEFHKSVIATGIFLELNKIQKLNLELFTSNLPNIKFPVLDVLKNDLYFSELAIQPIKLERNNVAVEVDLLISIETEKKLETINPVFVIMYKGALEASAGDNVDKARHVLISLRELFKKLLNELCPNDQVIVWINGLEDKPKDYLIEGKPSRKAQINYYYRDEKDNFLEKFVNNKKLLLESLINISNSVHEDLDKISSDQLTNLIRSARYLIDDLLIKYNKK